MDLRWLQPLNTEAICIQARDCQCILIVDEGRKSAGIAEGVAMALIEGGLGGKPIARVCGADSYTPLAAAANLVLPSDESVLAAARALLARG
jgi:2-oxoisovalerate dehydrogenase E1 component